MTEGRPIEILPKGSDSCRERRNSPTLAEMSDVLRLIGNIGAHHGSAPVHPWQVHAIDNFFRAVVEYVYVAAEQAR